MVEYTLHLNTIFSSLSDATRRDILRRVAEKELSVSALAKPYPLSFAAIAKHIGILEQAKLVTKRREGKQQIVSVVPKTLAATQKHLSTYEKLWEERYKNLESLLKNN